MFSPALRQRDPAASDGTVLIVSPDAVAAALLGALIETLGYPVGFGGPLEPTEATIRRVRPRVCLLDCEDPASCDEEVLGRAAMRRIAVVIFGTRIGLEQVRGLALAHRIETLLVPPELTDLDATLRRALRPTG